MYLEVLVFFSGGMVFRQEKKTYDAAILLVAEVYPR